MVVSLVGRMELFKDGPVSEAEPEVAGGATILTRLPRARSCPDTH